MERLELIATLARAIDAATAEGGVDRAVAIVLDLARRVGAQQTLPGVTPGMTKVQSKTATVARLFAYWQEQCEKTTSKLTPERSRAIESRLRDGYTETEIRKAIEGAANAAHKNEDTGEKYDDLMLICRNGSKLEDFIARGERSTGPIKTNKVEQDSPVEEQIAALRRQMSELRKAGRTTEYEHASLMLANLMSKRERKAT